MRTITPTSPQQLSHNFAFFLQLLNVITMIYNAVSHWERTGPQPRARIVSEPVLWDEPRLPE